VPFGQRISDTIIARTGCAGVSISYIDAISPPGFTRGTFDKVNGTNNEWFLNFTWVPEATTQTQNLVCFKASDDAYLESEQYCFTLLAGVSAPGFFNTSAVTPSGILPRETLLNGTIYWSIDFDQPIMKPRNPANITIYNSNGTAIWELDVTSNETVVEYDNYTLRFQTNSSYAPDIYYITFDRAVALSRLYCHAESEACYNDTFWVFIANDTTILEDSEAFFERCNRISFIFLNVVLMAFFGILHILFTNIVLLFFICQKKFNSTRVFFKLS
jgi:hypothetical protein